MKYIILIAFFLLISYGIWYFKKYINYTFSYENMVQETCREEIKKELKKWNCGCYLPSNQE